MKIGFITEIGPNIGYLEEDKMLKTLDVIRRNSKYYKRFKHLNLAINSNENICIANTAGSQHVLIETLHDMYHTQGIKVFVGFSRSTTLKQAWDGFFSKYKDTYAISVFSTASSLNNLPRIYRVSPSDDSVIKWYKAFIKKENYTKVIIYNQGTDTYSNELCKSLGEEIKLPTPIVIWNINSKEEIKKYLQILKDLKSNEHTLVIPTFVSLQSTYFKVFREVFASSKEVWFDQLESVSQGAEATVPKDLVKGRYYTLAYLPFERDQIVKNLKQDVGGEENFSYSLFDALQIADDLASGNPVESIGTNGYLYMNKARRENDTWIVQKVQEDTKQFDFYRGYAFLQEFGGVYTETYKLDNSYSL